MIPPRGCAYIVMVHRQDANTALHKLSSGLFKVNQKPIKVCCPNRLYVLEVDRAGLVFFKDLV